MSQLNVDIITGRDGQAAPEFTKGAIITGVVTATTLNQNVNGDLIISNNLKTTGITTLTGAVLAPGGITANVQGNVTGNVTGNLTGDVTGDVTGNTSGSSGSCTGNAATATALATARNIGGVSFNGTAAINLPGVNQAGNQDTSGTSAGLTGTPAINVGNITAVDGTFSGNVSIAKTLTYEDVKNIDSVGLITARKGIVSSGVVTATSFDGEFKVVDESIDTLCFPLFSPNLGVSGGKASGIGSICAGSNLYFNSATGQLSATSYLGDGSSLTGVVSGIEVESSGSSVGTSLTAINFVGATVIGDSTAGISTVTISSSGISTEAITVTNNTGTLDLSKQDHKVTATGNVTLTCTGGNEGESHTIRVVNNGISIIGFSTYFLWPSGVAPSLQQGANAINLLSFTVHREGSVGIATQLLGGASVNFS